MTLPSSIIRLITMLCAAPPFAIKLTVTTGYGHTVVLKSVGTVWVWGGNYPNGQLGGGILKRQLKPVAVQDSKETTAIAACGWQSLVKNGWEQISVSGSVGNP